MVNEKKTRIKRRKMRSHKKLKQFLLAFGLVGIAIGLALFGCFALKGNMELTAYGLCYILVASASLGGRGILVYLDEQRKETRHRRKST